jgi:hypothetical protein
VYVILKRQQEGEACRAEIVACADSNGGYVNGQVMN